jgi:hypothetical protein
MANVVDIRGAESEASDRPIHVAQNRPVAGVRAFFANARIVATAAADCCGAISREQRRSGMRTVLLNQLL